MKKSNDKKRIYFIVHSLSGGGAERVISVISNHLVENGYDVALLMTHSDECAYSINPAIKKIVRENVKPKDMLNVLLFIRKWYKRDKDAIFVSFIRSWNLISMIAALGTRAKLVISERNNPAFKFNIKSFDSWEMLAIKLLSKMRQVKHVIFQTKGAMDCYPKSIHKKSSIIYNPLKSDLPLPFTGERSKRVVAVGRLTSQKNYPMLIRAFKKFSKTHSDYTLEIYGQGSPIDNYKEQLEEFISKLGVADKVKLCGFSKNIHNDILDAEIFAMASVYEGLSNALLEAMAIGVPVISTDHPPGGAREFINSYENGILTTNSKAKEMYEALCYMADNKEKAQEMAQNALTIREKLSTDKICTQWENVFNALY